MTALCVAAIQMRSGTEPAENVADFSALVTEAAAEGAHYVQTPEMTGLVQKDREALFASVSTPDEDPLVREAAALSARHGIYLHIGSTAVDAGGGMVANRAFLFSPDGTLIGTYDKIHMFDVDLDNDESWRESAVYRPGERTVVADTEFGSLGLGICYDLRFPALFNAQAQAGAQILTAPAAFTRQTGGAHWHVLIRARAIENGAFVIAAAQGGTHQDGRETFGHSLIVDPWGVVVAEADDDEVGIVTAEIDLDAVSAARAKIPNLTHTRPIDLERIRELAVQTGNRRAS